MPDELQAQGPSGKTLYALIRNATAQPWNATLAAFETYTAGNWGTYALALTEQGTCGYYVGTMPTGITTPGLYNVDVRLQAGASPATTDEAVVGGPLHWSGTVEPALSTFTDSTSLSRDPVKGTLSEAMAVIRALARGKKVESTGTNTLTVYADDDNTALFVINYAPTITAPTTVTYTP